MKELIDLQMCIDWFLDKCRKHIGSVLLAGIGFFLGVAWGEKSVVDDCRYMQVFRDGGQAYVCNVRVK